MLRTNTGTGLGMRHLSRRVELADVPSKSLLAYIKFLYIGVIAISQGAVPKPLQEEANMWLPLAKKVDKELGGDLVNAILQVLKTKDATTDLSPFTKKLRASLRAEVYTDTKVSHQIVDNLKALTAYLSSRSETAYRTLMKLSTELDQKISSALAVQPQSQKEFLKPLERIVYAATKDKGRTALTAVEAKALKASHPQVYAEYLKLRKSYNFVWKDELRALVSSSGKKAVSYQLVRKQLTGSGIQNSLSETFEGLIDAAGNIFTKKGKRLPGLPGQGFFVKMNPDYNATKDDSFVFTTVNAAGKTSQYVYTLDYKRKAVTEKFEIVERLNKVIDRMQAKWMRYIKEATDPTDPQTMASVMLELLYQFSARVGSTGNSAGGQDTYGLSTILVKNVKVNGSKVIISYLGKDAVKQVHTLDGTTREGKLLFNLIVPLLKDKAPGDRVWLYNTNNKIVPMTGNLVNRWFQKMGAPAGATVHKLRHVRGTRLFNDIVTSKGAALFEGPQKTEVQVFELLKTLATQVGKMLGHVKGVGSKNAPTGTTAIQNYIDPTVQAQFYDNFNVRYPKYLDKMIGGR